MTRASFIEQVRRAAQDLPNVNADGAAAHAALESAFGTSALAVQGHNLWGVKAISWAGETITFPTWEYLDGKWVKVDAPFRKYESIAACVVDYDGILGRVYPETAKHRDSLVDWLACLWLRGPYKWSTDPLIYPKVLAIALEYGMLGAPAQTHGSVPTVVLNHLTPRDRLAVLFGGAAVALRGGLRWRVAATGEKLDLSR